MRRSTPRALGTALLLLLAVSVPALAAAEGKKKDPKASPPQADSQPKQDFIDSLGEQIDELQASVEKIAGDTKKVEQVRADQQKLGARLEHVERQSWMTLFLLGLIAVLAVGAVLLSLLQLRAVRALERRVGKTREKLSSGSAESEASEVGGEDGDSEERAELPVRPLEGTPPTPRGDTSRLEWQPGEAASRTPPQPHQRIADLLVRLHAEAPTLAESFADLSLRERFRGELGAPLKARLDRLLAYSDEAQLRERWLGPDLVPTLDALSRFYSEAIEEGRHGRAAAKGLARDLRHWLYDDFSSACRSEGWFVIDPIDPYKTEFDPNVHHAIAGRDVDGAEGKVLAVKAIGRRDPKNGAVVHKAEVIVGR